MSGSGATSKNGEGKLEFIRVNIDVQSKKSHRANIKVPKPTRKSEVSREFTAKTKRRNLKALTTYLLAFLVTEVIKYPVRLFYETLRFNNLH